ncbi:MAG TPA: hypothetical protein VHD87_14915 [Acidimicrobiales bacterium]|nr:hypothetical protein [Acidimicrobiales bacterium]
MSSIEPNGQAHRVVHYATLVSLFLILAAAAVTLAAAGGVLPEAARDVASWVVGLDAVAMSLLGIVIGPARTLDLAGRPLARREDSPR